MGRTKGGDSYDSIVSTLSAMKSKDEALVFEIYPDGSFAVISYDTEKEEPEGQPILLGKSKSELSKLYSLGR